MKSTRSVHGSCMGGQEGHDAYPGRCQGYYQLATHTPAVNCAES